MFQLVPVLVGVVPKVLGVIAKVGGKIGGFFKKLFGGKKKRRAARLAAKQQRIEDASNTILANKIAKLEQQANLGEAKASVKLAKIERQLARQGISFDAGVQDATTSDLSFSIPQIFRKVRNPQVFQQPSIAAGPAGDLLGRPTATPVMASVAPFNIQAFLSKPLNIVLVVVGFILLFGRRLFK